MNVIMLSSKQQDKFDQLYQQVVKHGKSIGFKMEKTYSGLVAPGNWFGKLSQCVYLTITPVNYGVSDKINITIRVSMESRDNYHEQIKPITTNKFLKLTKENMSEWVEQLKHQFQEVNKLQKQIEKHEIELDRVFKTGP